MTLEDVVLNGPHVTAHNDERHVMNDVQATLTDMQTHLDTLDTEVAGIDLSGFEPVGLLTATKKTLLETIGSRILAFGHSMMASAETSTFERGVFHKICSSLRANGTNLAASGAVLSRNEVVGSGAGGIWNVLNNWQQTKQWNFRGAYDNAVTYHPDDVVTQSGFWWKAYGLYNGSFSGHLPGADAGNAQSIVYWRKIDTHADIVAGIGHGALSYQAQPAIPMLWYGANDLAFNAILNRPIGVGSDALNRFIMALRSALSFTLSAAIFDDDDLTVSYGADFAARVDAGNGTQYGTGARFMPPLDGGASAPKTLTIQVPPDFPGGKISLGFGMSAAAIGLLGVSVDGGATSTLNIAGLSEPTTYNNSIVFRTANLAAGAHTITCALGITGAAFTVWFDWWGVDAVIPGPAIVPALVKFPTATYAGDFYNSKFGDADIVNWNNAIKTLITSEFPSAIYADVENTLTKFFGYFPDGVHLSDQASEMVADVILDSIKAKVIDSTVLQAIASQERSNNIQTLRYAAAGSDMVVPAVSNTFMDIVFGTTTVEVPINALPGDLLEFKSDMKWLADAGGARYADLAIMVNGGIVDYVSSRTTSPLATGLLSTYWSTATEFHSVFPSNIFYVVQQRDVKRGVVTIRPRVVLVTPSGPGVIYGSAAGPSSVTVENHGQPNPYRGGGIGL